MSEKTSADVFVSYSSKNKSVADAIVADFEKHGIRCWYAPRDIMPGESWVSAITDALQSVKVQVLVYTDESNASRQVMNEVAVAFNAGKTIVPFRLTEAKMSSEFEYYLSRVHWLDALTSPLNDNVAQLRQYVEVILSGVDKVYAAGTVTPPVQTQPERKQLKLGLIIGICLALVVLLPVIIMFSIHAINNRKDTGHQEIAITDDGSAEVENSYSAADIAELPESETEVKTDAEDNATDGSAGDNSVENSDAESNSDSDKTVENDGDSAASEENTDENAETGENNTDNNKDNSDNNDNNNNNNNNNDTSDSSQEPADTGASAAKDSKDDDRTEEKSNDTSDSKSEDTVTEKDVSDMTVEELERAAKKGDVAACDELGAMYYDGEGVDQDYGKALLYLTRAEENGTKSAKTYKRLGDMYYYGKGVDESDQSAGKYYAKAIDLGSDDAGVLSNYGMVLYRDDDFEDSAKYFSKAAKSNKDPMTMYNAGLAYYGAEDYDNALTWFGKAIDSGYTRPEDVRGQIRSMVDAGLVSEKAAKKWAE